MIDAYFQLLIAMLKVGRLISDPTPEQRRSRFYVIEGGKAA